MTKHTHPVPRRAAGFTLVEMIIAIVLTGILSGIVAVFIVKPVEGYIASVRRAGLTDAADTSIRRLAREVRTALPNSLRQSGTNCLEFLPIVGGGRYRNAARADAVPSNVFNFSDAAAFSFDVLADTGVGSLPSGTNYAVVYNLGIPGSDAYAVGTAPIPANKRQILSVTGTAPAMTVSLDAGPSPLFFDSPGKRFHVIPNYSVAFYCTGGNLVRATQAISATNSCPSPSGAISSTVLVSNVDCSKTSLNYTPAALQRNGLLALTLVITRSDESVQVYNEIHVNNVP